MRVARLGEMRNIYIYIYVTFWSENMKGKVQLGDMGIDGKVLLKWILNMIGRREVDSSGS